MCLPQFVYYCLYLLTTAVQFYGGRYCCCGVDIMYRHKTERPECEGAWSSRCAISSLCLSVGSMHSRAISLVYIGLYQGQITNCMNMIDCCMLRTRHKQQGAAAAVHVCFV